MPWWKLSGLCGNRLVVGSTPTLSTSPTTLKGVQNSGDGLPFKGLLVPPSLTSSQAVHRLWNMVGVPHP